MAHRVTLSTLLATTAFAGNHRASGHFVVATTANSIKFTAQRITGHYLVGIVNANSGFWPILLESVSEIYDSETFSYKLSTFPIPEHNPYRPQIPDQFIRQGDDIYDFNAEQQRTLRQQHDFIQAGDSTFPFQMFVTSHPIQHFKLGSLSRFYHNDYGIIHARYVKFAHMKVVQTPCCPVGLLKKNNGLDWVVTNDYTLSHPDMVVGISAAWTLPVDGDYGWAVMDGPLLQQLVNNSTTQEVGEQFSWDGTGSISNSATGKTIGRRIKKTPTIQPTIGTVWFNIEGMSPGDIDTIINGQLSELNSLITTLQSQIAALQASASSDQMLAIQNNITLLTKQLALESSSRASADAGLSKRIDAIDAVSAATLSTSLAALRNTIESQIATLNDTLTTVESIANNALALASSSTQLTLLKIQVQNLQTILIELIARPKGKFPVVDGSVPPSLVYLDDGSLVYTETF